MIQSRSTVLACATLLALTGGASALGAQATRPSRDSLAYLSLASTPSGRVAIDDSIVGETPKAVSVPAGTHQIRISRDGYLPYETTITILRGEHLRLRDIVLKEKPKPGS
jgi:PEGA domain